MSKRKQASEWFEVVAAWEKSGASAMAWCREREIGYQSFLYWRRKRRNSGSCEGALSIVPQNGFCEILPSEGLTAEIGGIRLRLERGFDPVLFREVIAAIRGA